MQISSKLRKLLHRASADGTGCIFQRNVLAQACASQKRRRGGFCQLWTSVRFAAMAVTLLNDLESPVEVQDDEVQWLVAYPGRSVQLSGKGPVRLRLRDEPARHGVCTRGGALKASQDFEEISRRGRELDAAEQRAVARERQRRQDATARQLEMIEDQAKTLRNKDAAKKLTNFVCAALLPLVFVLVLALVAPGSAVAAALLAVPAACCCGCLGLWVGSTGPKWPASDHILDCRGRALFNAAGLLGLAAVAWMTLRNADAGYWWTGLLVLPVACCGVCCWTCLCCRGLGAFGDDNLPENLQAELRREREEADLTVKNRTIRFEGRVIREHGRPCVASWPGKYEGAWEALVAGARGGEVSAAVVFLPDGTEDHGQHDPIPEAEGLDGKCWCVPLYGEEKPWGCRWWSQWLKNVETAVESGAELKVYFMANLVGQGKVESFETAGKEHLVREQIQGKLTRFKDSPHFQAAVVAGLDGLSREQREDSTSRYSREVQRLFFEWLPAEEAELLKASEGLGNSQKAEVAWLERKGYPYREVDVSTWLTEDAVEVQVPGTSHEAKPQSYGRVIATE